MPLPTTGAQWPPLSMRPAMDEVQRCDAWLTSDTDMLEILYSVTHIPQKTSLWGQVKRTFWGSPGPNTTDQRPVKMHVPVAAEVARMSAQNLFGEMPTITFEPDKTPTPATVAEDANPAKVTKKLDPATQRLTELLDDRAHAMFIEAAELASGHGWSFIKITWDKAVVPDKPFLDVVPADAAIPEFRWGRLVAVTFWRDLAPLAGSRGSYRLLERHEPGTIELGLYETQDAKTLGVRIPLTDHPDTADLATLVNDASIILTGSKLLTAQMIPNGAANGQWRKIPSLCDLPASDFQGAFDLFDDVDELWTSLRREFRLAKARAVVPSNFVNSGKPGSGATFNADQEFFVQAGEAVSSGMADAKMGDQIEFLQPALRSDEHLKTIAAATVEAYKACGFSPQSFGDSATVAVTATEVNAREKLTMLTRSEKILYQRPNLADLLAALMDVDQAQFAGVGRHDRMPTIEFADSSAQDPKVLADTLASLNTSESASIRTRVGMLHEDWDDTQIDSEVAQIKEDYSMLPDPTAGNLWAAQSANGSNTGGVLATNSGGVQGTNIPDPTAPDPVPPMKE